LRSLAFRLCVSSFAFRLLRLVRALVFGLRQLRVGALSGEARHQCGEMPAQVVPQVVPIV
jgi:hypothetical protein